MSKRVERELSKSVHFEVLSPSIGESTGRCKTDALAFDPISDRSRLLVIIATDLLEGKIVLVVFTLK